METRLVFIYKILNGNLPKYEERKSNISQIEFLLVSEYILLHFRDAILH